MRHLGLAMITLVALAGCGRTGALSNINTIHIDYAQHSFSRDIISDEFDPGVYYGLRLRTELSLNTALSFKFGISTFDAVNLPDVELITNATSVSLETSRGIGHTISRWYTGIGGGYNYVGYTDMDSLAGVVDIEDETFVHARFGLEIREYSGMSTLFEVSHYWMAETDADTWLLSVGLGYVF